MVERFIRCRQCNRILPLPRIFAYFETPDLLPGVEWSDEDSDFRREFTFSHGNHPQEELVIDPETIFSEKPSYEPVRTSYFEATNGRQKFLIQRTKPGLEHPARYEILPGQMKISNLAIKIQEADLRRQISADRTSSALSAERVSEFIAAFNKEVAAILPYRLFKAIEAMVEGDSPRFIYAALKQERWEKILDRCARNFQASELRWIREFIQNHRQPGEVLSLLVHRKISFLAEESLAPANHEFLALRP
jgi:hypothetical protein